MPRDFSYLCSIGIPDLGGSWVNCQPRGSPQWKFRGSRWSGERPRFLSFPWLGLDRSGTRRVTPPSRRATSYRSLGSRSLIVIRRKDENKDERYSVFSDSCRFQYFGTSKVERRCQRCYGLP